MEQDKTLTTEQADKLFDQSVESIANNTAPPTGEVKAEAADGTKKPEGETGKAGAAADANAQAGAKEGEKKPEPAAEDPFKDLPEERRKAVNAAIESARAEGAAKVAEAEKVAKRHQDQVGGYEKQLREARAALEAAKATGTTQEKKVAEARVAETNAKLQKIKADFPSIAEAMEAVIAESTAKVRRELEEKFGAEVNKVKQQFEPIAKAHVTSLESAEEAAIEAAHPGWKELAVSKPFIEWFEQQSAGVQALAKGGAQDEVALFDRYRTQHPLSTATPPEGDSAKAAAEKAAADKKAEADRLAAQRGRQLQDAAGPSGKGTKSPGLTTDQADTAEAMFNAAVDKLAREFRIQ
jgi:hypothetical protein